MDPQWNLFQPPNSEPAVLDYNRPYNSTQQTNNYASQNTVYNGFYDSPSSSSSNQSNFRNSKPPSSSSNMISSNPYSSNSGSSSSPSYYNSSSGNNRQSSQSQMPPRSPESNSYSSQSNYYSGNNSSSSSSSQYVPPISDFKIGTFTLNSNGYPSESNNHDSSSSYSSQNNSSYQQNNGSSTSSQSARETGIIEKLLQTYGFIQCCERQARLFFHFSQFDGNTEHLRIGDPVEFEVTFDRRTGKPIASTVTKISPEVVLSEERVVGVVTTELKSEHSGEQQGRITYENRGECFFLPYCKEDVEGYVTLKPGDKVSFQIATNQRSGNLAARHVRLENPVEPVKYQGVVSAIKDSYGFIERADVVDEIFFHFSEAKTIPGSLKLGDDVEFLIQTRNGKEVATNMVKLNPGTVVFEDVNQDEIRGQVLKPVEKARQNQKDPLTGRIRYRGKDRSEVEVKFGERDQKGDFSLRHGDWVKFNIATDRRDHLQKATNISLLDESFNVSGEKREQGLISSLKDGFGFIKCAERDAQIQFHYNELLDPQREICLGEEVEFTATSDPAIVVSPNRICAIRIRILSPGTVKFEFLIQEGLQGEVTFEPSPLPLSPTSGEDQTEPSFQPGIISFSYNSIKQTINYYPIEGKKTPQLGDKVEFNMYLIKRTKEHVAMDMKILPSSLTSVTPSAMASGRQNVVGSGRTFDRGGQQPPQQSPQQHHLDINSHPFTMDLPTTPTNNFFQPMKAKQVSPVKDNPMQSPTKLVQEPESKETPVNGITTDNGHSVIRESSSSESESENSDMNFSKSSSKSQSFSSFAKGASNSSMSSSRSAPVHQGFIATLKDSFGFIETSNHDKEIFFHFSNLDGNVNDLDLGQEVEYTISSRTGPGGKLSAENVRSLPVGSLPTPKILGKVYEGAVLRSMRSVNPDQQEYCGLVCVGKEEEKLGKHQFGITGLVNKKELLQPGDLVTFQLDEDGWAVNIRAVRKKLLATVETIKGQYGFLNYGSEEGKRLFFHQSEVKDNITLSPGDEVQFVIITNLKTGKSSACNITRMLTNSGPSQRPDRLVSKLKSMLNLDSTKPRIQVMRKPRGPDGTKGFKVPRDDIDDSN